MSAPYNTNQGGQVPKTMKMHRADSSSMSSSIGSLGYDSTSLRSNSASADHDEDNRGIRRHVLPKPNINLSSDADSAAVGILASGLAWVQRSRDLRRRQYLQSQAEQQLRKIAAAERSNRSMNGGDEINGISDNILPISSNGNDHSEDQSSIKIGTRFLSKSGEGASGKLDFDIRGEEEFMVPKVRIHVDPRNGTENGDDKGTEPPKYILTPEQMQQVAMHVLPKTIAYCPWKLLYGLARDGDSFDGCLRVISNINRTLMVVRTTRGAVFGGYADSAWHSNHLGNAVFYGNASAALFSIIDPEGQNGPPRPNQKGVKVYRWSGKNRYIQLCDVSSKMLAFGGGGADGAFGLCVEEDFQTGSTGPCDTFDNEPLCDQETFDIVDVEFWEFLTGVF